MTDVSLRAGVGGTELTGLGFWAGCAALRWQMEGEKVHWTKPNQPRTNTRTDCIEIPEEQTKIVSTTATRHTQDNIQASNKKERIEQRPELEGRGYCTSLGGGETNGIPLQALQPPTYLIPMSIKNP